MAKSETVNEHPAFSLVLGGLLFQLYGRLGLSGDSLEKVRRRVLVMMGLAWLPPLVLSIFDGHTWGGSVAVPFLYDVETHARFLVALPILIWAELIIHNRLRTAVNSFEERHIITTADLPRFRTAIESTHRWRDSFLFEIAIIVLVYTLGLWIWRSQVASQAASWYVSQDDRGLRLTLAGYWYAFVSIPIFQFILMRWYFRIFLWFRFLWKVSKLKLRVSATHPDRAGGLGFLGSSTYGFGPILFAQGALLAGLIADRVLYLGANLVAFKVEAMTLIIFMIVLVMGPLMVFTSHLGRARRKGLADYGGLASHYSQAFDTKWMRPRAFSDEELLGNADIQSLADLGNTFAAVKHMRVTPFGLKDVARLAAVTAVPLTPLALTIFSLEELAVRLIKILF